MVERQSIPPERCPTGIETFDFTRREAGIRGDAA